MTSRISAAPAALTGLAGLAVLAVMLQSSGGFAVELLGPDLVLAVAGFAVTYRLLSGASAPDRVTLTRWYRSQLAAHVPLLLMVIAGTITIIALIGSRALSGDTATDAATSILSIGEWWELAARLARPDRINPLGSLWLIALLVQFGLVWPMLLLMLRRIMRATNEQRVLHRLTPALVAVAIAAWLIGPLRAAATAQLPEFTVGAHVRAVEWLTGAAAAAAAVGLRGHGRHVSRWESPALAVVGGAMLVGSSALATSHPIDWLRFGGTGGAAFGAAVLLLAVHVPEDGPLAEAVGWGFPVELGRMASALLVLHAPAFWAIRLVFPSARPFGLLIVGGAIAWLVGLLLQDGLVRRMRFRRKQSLALVAGAAAVVVAIAGEQVAGATQPRQQATPVVMVLGGPAAGGVAAALSESASRYTIVDASRLGCGLLDVPPESGSTARTTALAQAPPSHSSCGGDQVRLWGRRVAAVRPDAIVVDLSADATARDARIGLPSPCDPRFRALYRGRFAAAVDAWTEGAPKRPVLLATVPDEPGAVPDGPARCFAALVAELVGSHRSVVPLGVDGGDPAGLDRRIHESMAVAAAAPDPDTAPAGK